MKIKEINPAKLAEAFASIKKHDLKVSTMICAYCGNMLNFKDKKSNPCKHQKEIAKQWRTL